MQRSLSILLPVRNAQATLADSVHELLEVVEDSIERFEVLIIDDGSTDATAEVAHELTRLYPQVRVIHHGAPLGEETAIRTGLQKSQGEVVVMRAENGGFRLLAHRDPAKLWGSRPTRPNYLSRLRNFVVNEE